MKPLHLLLLCLLYFPAINSLAQSQMPDFDDIEITTTPLGNDLYMLQGLGGNIGVSVGEDGAFVIDDQFAPLTDKIRAAITRLTPKPIGFVINTHFHRDHTGGNANLAEADATIIAHHNTYKHLAKGAPGAASSVPKAALPVITFAKSMILRLNGQSIRVLHIPAAHTNGDLIVYFPKADVLHTGDGYFNGSYPNIDVAGGGSINGMIALSRKVMKISGKDTKIIPGHGDLSSRAQLKEYLQMLMTVRKRVESAINEKVKLEELIAQKPLEDLDKKWGNGFIKADHLLTTVYTSLMQKDGYESHRKSRRKGKGRRNRKGHMMKDGMMKGKDHMMEGKGHMMKDGMMKGKDHMMEDGMMKGKDHMMEGKGDMMEDGMMEGQENPM